MSTNNNQILYKETQPLTWLVILFAAITIVTLLATYFKWGSKPIPSWDIGIILALLSLLPILLVYHLKIEITNEYALAQFGVGLLKRKVPIIDLDIDNSEIVNLPFSSGVGYRISNRGVFLNTKPGPALFIPSKSGKKNFFVGTKNAEAIKKAIRSAQM